MAARELRESRGLKMKTVNFINLTNGIEAIQEYNLKNWRAIRIQSCACEQKLWEDILNSLSDDFLLNVALGNKVIVYDYGANKEISRAVWQGLEWIKFVLYQGWIGEVYYPQGRAEPMKDYFQQVYYGLGKRVRKRLGYFKKFFNGKIDIQSVTSSTIKDGNYELYVDMLKKEIYE